MSVTKVTVTGNGEPMKTAWQKVNDFIDDYEAATSLGTHVSTHENSGADEISVTGLSGLLADDQHVLDAEVLAVAAAKGINADITSMTGLNDDGIPLAKVANAAGTGDKLSVFAATTSAELRGVISDEIGAGKLRFDTSVTAKTTTATLTIAEAGTILVSATSAYTITLPTAVGNTGLTYDFVKTDFNYNLITLAANGTETFNYPNDDGTTKTTYPRLNTGGAKATIVSDGSNWIVTKEDLGQVPGCKVYLSASQLNLLNGKWTRVELDTESYDVGSNFDISPWVSGNATSTLAGHLVDSAGAFTSDMVRKRVKNTTDSTYAYITAYNSATDVTISPDIFVDTEGYEIKHAKFVAPISGKYFIQGCNAFLNTVADTKYVYSVFKNGSGLYFSSNHAAFVSSLYFGSASSRPLAKNDYIELYAKSDSGDDAVDLSGGVADTAMQIYLISKD